MSYKFAAAPMSLFGFGSIGDLEPLLLREKLKKALIVTDQTIKKLGLLEPVISVLDKTNVQYAVFDGVKPNPTIENVQEGLQILKSHNCDVVVAVGGGSANDCAKAIKILHANGGEIQDYVGANKAQKRGLFLVAINTTAGTASEVSRAYLISDESTRTKLIFKDDYAMPDVAINDAQLMMKLPSSITAQTGMDALTHAIESYISKGKNTLTDILALDAIKLIFNNLETAVEQPDNKTARENMSCGQYLAGLSFGNAGLGLVHAMAHQLGAIYNLPHGLCNAILLPVIMQYDYAYCKKEFSEITQLLSPISCNGKTVEEQATLAIQMVNDLSAKVKTNIKLSDLGVKLEDLPLMAEKTLKDGCINSSPHIPDKASIIELYRQGL